MSTKMASLSKLRDSGREYTLEQAVLAHVKQLGPISRDSLCVSAGIRISSACAALNTLEKRGEIVVAADKVYNPETKRWVKAYEVAGGK